jgi:hypothetical protein
MGMFEHVSILLSFVFAIAITHLLTSVTELVWSRDRVRVSGLQFLWMFNAMLVLLVNWIGMFYLSVRPRWDIAEVTINFVAALVQYFTCSLISLRPREEGVIDMPAFYERQRPYIFGAFLVMTASSMFENWWDSNLSADPHVWIHADLTVAPMLVFIALAGWARAEWLQWVGGITYGALSAYFLFTYALSAIHM